MKIKITSLLLTLSLIVSLFTIYSFAEDVANTISDAKSGYTTSYLHYKNTFGDDSDDTSIDINLANSVNSKFEVKSESNGNKYGYFNFNDSNKNVFFELCPNQTYNIGSDKLGYLIFEMDFNDLGNSLKTKKFLEVNSGKGSFAPAGGRVCAEDILNIANDSKGNYFYFCGDTSKKIYIKSNEWTHIRCEFSVFSTTADKYNLRCYIGSEYFESSFTFGTPQLIYQIRVGSTNSTNQIFGFDNITIYSTPDNSTAPYGEVLTMKVGAENASVDGVQIELPHTPLLLNGQIYCPVGVLEDFTDAECPEEYVVVIDGTEYILLDNIKAAFGISARSYDMGLVLVGNEFKFLGENASYNEIMALMKTFVFNIPTADKLKSDVANHTNGYDHPYLLVNADRFSELRDIYNKGAAGRLTAPEDLKLYDYIRRYLDSAKSNLNTYCGISENGTYNGIKAEKIPVNSNYSNYSNNGYDIGGRVSVPTGPLLYFAFAYQMTGNLNYVRAAYDFMLYLGEWNHWGPDHFLNCADTAAPFAIAYDWMYDAFVELNNRGEKSKFDGQVCDKSKLATILFTHVIIPGYVQSNNLTCPWPGSANSRYATKTSNWNAVCTSGVVAAALMLLEEEVPTAGMTFNTQVKKSSTSFTQTVTPIEKIGNASIHAGLNTYADYAAKLTTMNLGTLAKYGLNQYVPDGSYVESPSYWSYGTNTYFRLMASLLSATGDDYGFMDAWGIDTTCYFAIHSESSDYRTWNFNDGSVGKQDSSFFFFVGNYYGDNNLVKVRKKHLDNGKTYSLYDILYYDTSIVGEPDLSTEYNMVGIDAFSVRSSWDKGAIYSGIIGGPNSVSHGQMDAGSFIYHNKGKIWFADLGADQYNMSIGYFSNFNLYRVGPEGHNIIMITSEQSSLPYGQSKTANPKIVKSLSGHDGGYAVLDMSDAYGTHVTNAQRGLLFTNSRNTVIIQDEYVFDGPKTAYWFGHYEIGSGHVENVVVSADGRTAFMVSGDDIIRVSIVSDNQNLKFEIMDAYTYLLDKTHVTDRNTMDTGTTEINRDSIRKLAIKCENVTELNLAVVIEEVNGYDIGTSYTYTDIDDWTVEPQDSSIIGDKFKAEFEPDTLVLGSYELKSQLDAYLLQRYNVGANSYIGVIPSGFSYTSNDSYLRFNLKNNASLRFRDYRYVTFDADLFTEGAFIENAELGVNFIDGDGTVRFVKLFTFKDNTLVAGSVSEAITSPNLHITVIIDTNDRCAWVYAGGRCVAKLDSLINSSYTSLLNFEIKLPAKSSSASNQAIFLDNISVRSFTNAYDDTKLDALLSSNSPLTDWEDMITTVIPSSPLAVANGTNLYTNAEIEIAISNGYDITLLRDLTGTVNVSRAVRVNTGGYRFEYTSNNYVASYDGSSVVFTEGTVTVKWHIGDKIITEEYNSSAIATFKNYSDKIGKITYEKKEYDSGVKFNFYTTGWSQVPGGNALAAREMVVSNDNCEFWLVNNVPVDCLAAKIDASGNATLYYNYIDLVNMMSKNNGTYDVVLCRDVELSNVSTITLSNSKVLYLNGHVLKHSKYDDHFMLYNGAATGSFTFVGPGTIEAVGSRTVFTSTSSTSDQTSKFGIIARNVTFKFNTQFADIRIGQHKFINCTFEQNGTTKSMFALWNKNPLFGGGGVPENLLTVTFEGCNISGQGDFISYSASSYSEVYVIDTILNIGSALVDSSATTIKFSVSGSSSVIANRIFKKSSDEYRQVTFNNGVTTNLQIPGTLMKSTSVLTNNYNVALPYRISDEYAKVIWKSHTGDILLSELVAIGVTPKVMAAEVVNYLNTSGYDYTYDLFTVDSTSDLILTPIKKASAPILQSMTLQNDLTMYLYISKADMDNHIQSVTVAGKRIMNNSYELVDLNGVSYYRYSIASFAPSMAAKEISIVIEYSDGRIRNISISAVSYLADLLATSANDNEKILAVKTLKYIQSAYSYFNKSQVSEVNNIESIVDQYKKYDVIYGNLKEESAATGLLQNAIASACFNLSASVRIRFYLNSAFNGTLSVTYNGTVVNYSISNGRYNGYDYIEVVMSADKLNDTLILSDGVNSVAYGLNAYATATNNTDSKLRQLLVSLSDYSSAAQSYVNSK